MKPSSYCRINLLLAVLCFFIQASCWAQTGSNVWESGPVGSEKVPGSGTVSGTGPGAIYTVSGQGYFFATSDSGYFYYHQLSGDGTLVARLLSQTGSALSSRYGVMIRPSTDGRDPNIYVGLTPSGAFSQVRMTQSDKTYFTNGQGGVPFWVKVQRQGTSVSGWTSPDGTNWTQLGPTVTVSWPDSVLIGLAVGSNSADLSTATFDNVTLTPGTPTTSGTPPITSFPTPPGTATTTGSATTPAAPGTP